MNAKELKRTISEHANMCGLIHTSGSWIRQSSETLLVLQLQKSNYGNYFELNLKIFGSSLIRVGELQSRELARAW
jgi:hypothetical protein